MKTYFFLYISVTFLLISCKDSSQSSKASGENMQANEQVTNKFFYIEFVNLDSTKNCRNSIELVKKELLYNGYVAYKESNNDWYGIRKINESEHIKLEQINEYHPNIHRFLDYLEYDSNNDNIEKIVIDFNKPINDTIPNFNYSTFKKLGHDDWQSVLNAGSFKYKGNKEYDESELANWIIKTIVLLTFK
tara:strand:+ start:1210 stop:1779 length:570 start_codon:yes stop_codon:yes gene_type:complete